jgi:two-component system chemotaxis sensor kinase CheA
MDEMEELKQEFLSEAYELLNTMEDGILKLEENPEDKEAINGIFRVAHTLKGGAASLELSRIANFTHELENLFDKVRDGLIKVDEDMIDIILKSLDILKEMVSAAARTVEPPEGIEEETLQKIIRIQKAEEAEPIPEANPVKEGRELLTEITLGDYELEKISDARETGKNVLRIDVVLNPDNPMRSVSGLQIYTALKEIGDIVFSTPHIDTILEEEFVPEMNLIVTTELKKSTIRDKIYLSDVTHSVEVEDFHAEEEPREEKQREVSSSPKEKKGINGTVKERIGGALKRGQNVYKVTVEIEKDNPMRNVDSLLIYNTLDEMGEILDATPPKETLRGNEFYPVLDIILASDASKEKIKEKCTISGTTKSLKVATFKPKAGAEKEDEEKPEKTPSKTAPAEGEKTENEEEAAEKSPQKGRHAASAPKSFLRVESSRIDILMNQVSELVISKAGLNETALQIFNMVETMKNYASDVRKLMGELHVDVENTYEEERINKVYEFFDYITKSSWNELDNFENITNIISRVINELQESVMKIRMVPISSIFNRFPRIVRDLSKNLSKEVELKIYGEDTELDKSVIEELLDPLVHMVRNAIDHGLESPDMRKKRGKSETGTIVLGASHEGSMIKIEIQDDGNGLDMNRIKAKAIEKGLIPENKELSKEETLNLIFLPGFSTAANVTEVSGRGVGMDVVKKKIENLSGSIFVETEQGKGSKFIIKIPLTLAIIQALIVEINNNSYSIPINNIVETLTVTADQIEMFENNQVIRLREELITIINLKEIFNLEKRGNGEEEEKENRQQREKLQKTIKEKEDEIEGEEESEELLSNEKYVVVVEINNKKAGFLVDTVIAEQDIVIKPLHKKYAMTKGISGATILGDGRISLIVDIYQLIDMYIKKEEYISIK